MRWIVIGFSIVITSALLYACGGQPNGDGLSPSLSQAQLAELHKPAGVDAKLWSQLIDTLKQALAARGTVRATSAAPLDNASKVPDLAVAEGTGGAADFTFSYRNCGDYDQNGQVALSDLVPVAINFGKNSTSLDWQAAQVADGNLDLTVSLPDVTTIGQHWMNLIEGYELQVSPVLDPTPTWTVVTEIPLSSGVVPGGGGFKHFAYTLATPALGSYYRVVPFEGAAATRTHGIASDPVLYNPDVLPAPTGLYATDGDYIDKVVLSWTKSAGATNYAIYRDSQGAPLATVGDVDTYDDSSVGDTIMHTYWLKASDGSTESDFGVSNDGYKGSAMASTYVVLGWNDLGMHCMNQNFSTLMILPPYNTLHAQVIQRGADPQIVTGGVTVSYEIPGNTTSVGKTDFWDNVGNLLGVTLPADTGLTGHGLSGEMTSLISTGRNDWNVTGIPITPLNDAMQLNSYALSKISVLQGPAVVAETQAVVPVSWEISCNLCHSSEAAILSAHDGMHGTDLANATPVLCGNCHAQPELGLAGNGVVPSLSSAMHTAHAPRMGMAGLTVECYACHPGQVTQCLRDVHFSNGMICNDCHGDMTAVGNPARAPWADEPRCDNCHTRGGFEFEQVGTLYRDSIGHNGVHCAACHGSPHAIQATVVPADNVQALALQGHAGKIDSCVLCHMGTPGDPFNHTVGEAGGGGD